METVYFYCAAIGGGLLLLQVLLLLFSGGDAEFEADATPDLDGDAPDASNVLFQLSLKTVIAFVTFFGIAGMASTRAELTATPTLVIAITAGVVAFLMVGYVMQMLHSLQSKGNVRLEQAIGHTAKVELRIPATQAGTGKVQVIVGGRMVSRKAVTSGEAIPTGAEVRIDAMHSPDTFQVTPLN
ncbi:MAG: NfeD family protein [Planctomycetes bacterium]|nr:NfeD family protein [Planctomycetota bacterium]